MIIIDRRYCKVFHYIGNLLHDRIYENGSQKNMILYKYVIGFYYLNIY